MHSERPDIERLLGESRRAGRRRRAALLALAVVAAVALAAFWFAGGSPDDGASYVTTPVTRGNLTVIVTATGAVQPTKQVEISSELSGTVRTVEVDYNDPVTVGQVLARLDTDKLEAAIAQSRAGLEARIARVAEAEATEIEARTEFQRTRTLAERDLASAQTLQAAEAALARAIAATTVARADVKLAEANLRVDETNLAKACICSPINGVVLERNVDAGQIVASSFQAPVLFTIAEDLSQMELRVNIDEADMGTVRVGQPASFTVEAYPERHFPAEIASVRYAPQTIDGVVTYAAILSIDNREHLLRPGMTATAGIRVEQVDDGLLVPNEALRYAPPLEATAGAAGSGLLGLLLPRPGARQVPAATPPPRDGSLRTLWVLKDGMPTPVEVRTGATDGHMTVILDGALQAGDAIITDQMQHR